MTASPPARLTVHHWTDPARGLREMRRVARGPTVVLTWDPEPSGYGLVRDYFPEILEIDRRTFRSLDLFRETLGPLEARPVPIPADCADGFLGAYWRRPERCLDPAARAAISVFSRFDPEPGLRRLRDDLRSGRWDERCGALRSLDALDLGYRLLVAGADSRPGPDETDAAPRP